MSKYSGFKKFMALLWTGNAMERHLDKAIDQQSRDEITAAVKQGDMTQDSASSVILSIAYADHCTAPLLARIAELEAAQTWQPIESAPKDGRTLLITYTNRCCKHRIILARWLTDEQVAEIDADGVGLKGGWYEQVDNWDEYSEVAIESEPTHWMPPPTPPKGGAS